MTPQLAPQRHETEIGDVTVGEREDKVGSVVGVQTDRQGLRRQRDLCPIPPFIQCFDDFWVADLEFADPSQRVANDRALGLQLPVVREVLQLRSEEHTSELQSRFDLVCRLLLETKNLA